MRDFVSRRAEMVERQLVQRGVADPDVVRAMLETPREAFVPDDLREYAYEDSPLPIGADQTISQPYVVAAMLEAAGLEPGDSVLEIGAGSGYAAAVMSRIVKRVIAIERHAELAAQARARLQALGYDNVEVRAGDGSGGCPEAAPFDAIIVSAGGPAVPQALKEQLEIGGVLIMPVGARHRDQRLLRVRRTRATHWEDDDLGGVSFVPMIGAQGWPEAAET